MDRPLTILQICPQIPFPPDDGGKISVWNITKHLAARGHRITMLTFGDQENIPEELQEIASVVTVKHDTRTKIFGIGKNLFSHLPYTISKYQTVKMVDALRRLCSEQKFDVVHTDYPHMLPYGIIAKKEFGLPLCHRAHDYETKIYRRYAEAQSRTLFKQYMKMQTKRIELWEKSQIACVDICVAITQEDANEILSKISVPMIVIPAGVDLDGHPVLDRSLENPHSIALLGSLSWQPNLDAAEWFLSEIFPLIQEKIPDATVSIIGASPPTSLLARQSENIRITGFVENVQKVLSSIQVLAVPLRMGGGMRIKLLEFFSNGKAVVSTTIGAEGNSAKPGVHYRCADTPEDFSRAIIELFASASQRIALGDAARLFVSEHYSWLKCAEEFEAAYWSIMQKQS